MTASADRAELLQLHDWDELLFGGFYCLRCTPDDEDPLDNPIAWPCEPLREAGITDDEARALIEAHREKATVEYEAKKRAEQAELRRRVDQFNDRHPVGTPVFAYPGARPEDIPSATRLVTRTRTKAQMSASGGDVVWVEGEGAYICLSHVDPVTEDEFEKARAEETAVAVAAGGALPVPVVDQPQPLDDTRLAETAARVEAASKGPWKVCEDYNDVLDGDGHQIMSHFHDADGQFTAHAREDVPALLAEVQRLKGRVTALELAEGLACAAEADAEARVAELETERHTTNEALSDAAEQLRANRDHIRGLEAELAKYVGKEPTIAEEMAYLSRSVDAVSALCDKAERQARRWENPLPVPEWVAEVRQALELAPTNDRVEETS